MRRPPRTQLWPSLVYRAEREEHRIAQEERRSIHERLAALAKQSEDEFIEHLHTCSDCRKRVAVMARSGLKLSSRILEAAKIDVLN